MTNRSYNSNDSEAGHEKRTASGPEFELRKLLTHPDAPVRELAVRLVGKLHLLGMKSDLLTLQQDADERVRTAVAKVLPLLNPDGGRGGAIIQKHGGYGGLKAYKASEIVYDATVVFVDRFIERFSRTRDQMVQAARSGKQNIVEASAAASISSKTELKLTGVARASLEELLEDYRDFLRQRSLPEWGKDHEQTQAIRKLAYRKDRSYNDYRTYFEQKGPEVAANTALCLIHQTNYLLDQLIKQLEKTFVEKGGLSERMTAARLQHRRNQQ